MYLSNYVYYDSISKDGFLALKKGKLYEVQKPLSLRNFSKNDYFLVLKNFQNEIFFIINNKEYDEMKNEKIFKLFDLNMLIF